MDVSGRYRLADISVNLRLHSPPAASSAVRVGSRCAGQVRPSEGSPAKDAQSRRLAVPRWVACVPTAPARTCRSLSWQVTCPALTGSSRVPASYGDATEAGPVDIVVGALTRK